MGQTVPPLCVVINGPSAAGKSTLTTAIQDRAERPLLRFGVDELFRMIPDHWGGGLPGARHSDLGFRYESVELADVEPDGVGAGGREGVRRIRTGADGMRMLGAMNVAVVAMLRAGQGVIVDGQAFEPEANRDLESRLAELARDGAAAVAIVELRTADGDLEDRQRRHEHPVGLSLFHNRQPPQSPDPDLVIETTGRDATQVADVLWDWLVEFYPAIETGQSVGA
ncbi:chloramphenicol phosphotransferase [Promicromonospora sp. NPDC057488]|uniref:phosphotransferase-like protein n=1 Tax=Promicromonospora sp. NPDC057488 TaxID=3346147 RepID=UPI00366AD2FA